MKIKITGIAGGNLIIAIALVASAVVLRLPTLSSPLSGDEAISFNRYALLPWKYLLFNYHDANQHTLFSLLSNISLAFFGENELCFRLPSFLAGILTVPLLYYLGLKWLGSKTVSLVASCLLLISSPHLMYSQQGRGYALTVFFALGLIISSGNLVTEVNRLVWGVLLVFTGISMALTLPSNVYFLAAATLYGFFIAFQTRKGERKKLFPVTISFLSLFFLSAVYFYPILEDIKSGVRLLSFLVFDPLRLLELGKFLISPWSPWIGLFFVLGWLSLKEKKKHISFAIIFLVPLVLTLLSGLLGFSRTYIYLLPFVLLLVAQGLVKSVSWIMNYNKNAGYCLAGVLVLGVTLQPAKFLANHYVARAHTANATISEAQQVLSYASQKIPRGQLIVIIAGGPETSILNYYLRKRIQEDIFGIVSGRRPEKIIVISHRNVPSRDFSLLSYFSGNENPTLMQGSLKQVQAIGNILIHEFSENIFRLVPPSYDPDHESHFVVDGSKEISLQSVRNPKAFGGHALKVNKKGGRDLLTGSPNIQSVDIKKDGAYLLFAYARKYGQTSKAMLAEFNRAQWPPVMGFINPYLGRFKVAGSELVWQAVLVLSPVEKGKHKFQELIHVSEETSFFDGFQSFILFP